MTKTCTKCGIEKSLEEYHRHRMSKSGRRTVCKCCRSEEHKEQWKTDSAYRSRIASNSEQWRATNPEQYREMGRRGDAKRSGSAKRRASNKKYQRSEKGKIVIARREKTEKRITWHRDYQKRRRLEDLDFRIRQNLRTRLTRAIRIDQKSGSAVRDLGCSIEEFKIHIQNLFQEGMSWENWGHVGECWHLDHIIPLSSFDLADRDQFLKACHYTNIQPLWATDNFRKSDSF